MDKITLLSYYVRLTSNMFRRNFYRRRWSTQCITLHYITEYPTYCLVYLFVSQIKRKNPMKKKIFQNLDVIDI